jgi:hypothetical protein
LPYPIRESDQGYGFTTDYGIEYLIALTSDQELLPDEPFAPYLYSFSIIVLTKRTLVGDPRVEATVIDGLNRIFATNKQTIISYVCSLEDDLERPRRILFGRWFRQHGAGYMRLEFSDLENRIYAAAIFQEGHPYQISIEEAFSREYRAK